MMENLIPRVAALQLVTLKQPTKLLQCLENLIFDFVRIPKQLAIIALCDITHTPRKRISKSVPHSAVIAYEIVRIFELQITKIL